MSIVHRELEFIQRHQTVFNFSEQGFGDLCLKLDLLHDAAGLGQAQALTGLPIATLRGWLREIIFVAQETLAELDDARREPLSP